jgi:hypothetical protein
VRRSDIPQEGWRAIGRRSRASLVRTTDTNAELTTRVTPEAAGRSGAIDGR